MVFTLKAVAPVPAKGLKQPCREEFEGALPVAAQETLFPLGSEIVVAVVVPDAGVHWA